MSLHDALEPEQGDDMDKDIWRLSANAWLQTVPETEGHTQEHKLAESLLTVGGLRAAEQFVLCNMRLWWNADKAHGAFARALVRNGFVAANLTQAAHESFEQFMQVLAAVGQPRPVIHDTARADVSEDEAGLLGLVSLCQEGHNGHAIMTLKRWLPPTAYRVTLKNMIAFAGLAAIEGLVLPLRVKLPSAPRAAQHSGPRYLLH
jgi:hypothetical protein